MYNEKDALSINHNWLNAANINYILTILNQQLARKEQLLMFDGCWIKFNECNFQVTVHFLNGQSIRLSDSQGYALANFKILKIRNFFFFKSAKFYFLCFSMLQWENVFYYSLLTNYIFLNYIIICIAYILIKVLDYFSSTWAGNLCVEYS